jgi:hypothetical protein
MRTIRISITAAAMAAAATLLAAGPTATAMAGPVPAARSQHWSQVTPNGTLDIADIGLALGSHDVLNVVWANGISSAGHAAIEDTPISTSGAVGHATAVITGQLLVSYPDATVASGQIDAAWNGIQSSPGLEGEFIASRSLAGGSWSAPVNVPPVGSIPFTPLSDTATTGADGMPWIAYGGGGSVVVDHLGQATVHQVTPPGCCYYFPGLAVDGKNGATWVAYQALVAHHDGIYLQQLAASGTTQGGRQLLPGSVTGGNTHLGDQRIGITGRGHGHPGVYVAYVAGYPIGLRVELLKAGTRRAVTLARTDDSNGFAGATVTADPAGGLWAAWFEGDGVPPALFVRQSNSAVTAFGRTMRIGLPSGTSVIWKVYLSSQGSHLAVLALLTRNGRIAYWTTQVG